mgnify:CR=1 FL=1
MAHWFPLLLTGNGPAILVATRCKGYDAILIRIGTLVFLHGSFTAAQLIHSFMWSDTCCRMFGHQHTDNRFSIVLLIPKCIHFNVL